MKFGVREICDVTFKALQTGKVGGMDVRKGQPVLYIDSAKTSTIEGAATTVYAQGGKGNARLIAWEGEKTLTFTVEDALLSPIGFAILSGAGLFKTDKATSLVHCTKNTTVEDGKIALGEDIADAPIFVAKLDDGSIGDFVGGFKIAEGGKELTAPEELEDGTAVFVDYYVSKANAVTELEIDAANFAGYYYVEASTLFRRESDGKDLPAEITFPRVKIQSNFTFTMASTGDPSTFTFTMDAFPSYTLNDKDHKVLCSIQIIDEAAADATESKDSVNKEVK